MFDIYTKASGHFKVYDNNHKLIGETDNLITNVGLDSVSDRTWADSFRHLIASFGSPDPAVTDDYNSFSVNTNTLSTSAYALNPASYTLGSWNPTDGMTYTLGRAFLLTNYTSSPVTIQDLGTSPSLSSSSYILFSKAKLPTFFQMAPSSFVYVIYELRLKTLTSTKVSGFQVDYNNSYPTHALPAPNVSGVINLPFATVLSGGSVGNNNFASGQGFFEPSNTNNYLYKFGTVSPSLTSYFEGKRTAFEANPTITLNNTGTTHPGVSALGITSVNQLTSEGPYVPGSYEKRRHIIVSPVSTPNVERFWGMGISSSPSTVTARDTGWQVAFSTEYTRPSATFLKMFVRQSWDRA